MPASGEHWSAKATAVADKHATEARALAEQATERLGENAVEAAELAQLSIAHGLAAISTVIASGLVSVERVEN